MVINRVGVGSLARVAACLYASIGFIVGVCIFLVSLLGMGMPMDGGANEVPSWIAPVFGVGAVVILPLLYGALGAVAFTIGGLLYNVAARMVGGVQFEVDR